MLPRGPFGEAAEDAPPSVKDSSTSKKIKAKRIFFKSSPSDSDSEEEFFSLSKTAKKQRTSAAPSLDVAKAPAVNVIPPAPASSVDNSSDSFAPSSDEDPAKVSRTEDLAVDRPKSPPPCLPSSPVFRGSTVQTAPAPEIIPTSKPTGKADKQPNSSSSVKEISLFRSSKRGPPSHVDGSTSIKVLVKPIMSNALSQALLFTDLFPHDTVRRLQTHIYYATGLPIERQCLVFKDKQLSGRMRLLDLINSHAGTSKDPLVLSMAVRLVTGIDLPTFVDYFDDGFLSESSSSSENLPIDLGYDSKGALPLASFDDDDEDFEVDRLMYGADPVEDDLVTPSIIPILKSLSLDSASDVRVKSVPPEPSPLVTSSSPVYCHLCGQRCRPAMRIECRDCRNVFCTLHRFSDQHECKSIMK